MQGQNPLNPAVVNGMLNNLNVGVNNLGGQAQNVVNPAVIPGAFGGFVPPPLPVVAGPAAIIPAAIQQQLTYTANGAANSICRVAFGMHEYGQNHATYQWRDNMVTTLQPTIQQRVMHAYTNGQNPANPLGNPNIATIRDNSHPIANYISRMIYHGGPNRWFKGPIDEEGAGSTLASLAHNLFTLFGKRHHFKSPKPIAPAQINQFVVPIAATAIADECTRLGV